MLRKRDYQGRLSFHFFDRCMTDLATHRQKKVQQCPGKICRCSNSAILHGVEWDRLIVHRTLLAFSRSVPFSRDLTIPEYVLACFLSASMRSVHFCFTIPRTRSATSFITFFTYMLRQNVISFLKDIFAA